MSFRLKLVVWWI